MDLTSMVSWIKEFGFPIIVAVWALWRLDKNWGKGDGFQSSLDGIEEDLSEIKETLRHSTAIQTEIGTTIKILYTLISYKGGIGGDRDGI